MKPPFGAILAGGRNSRYGSHKALADVAGRPIIERIQGALATVTSDLILIANEPEYYKATGLRQRPDTLPELGALGGIYSALLWAREEGRHGVLAVACDMPFLEPRLLARIVEAATREGAGMEGADKSDTGKSDTGADIVVPESPGRRGVEPLCAYYSTTCIAAIEEQVARGERRVIGFYDGLRVVRIPLDEVRTIGDPAIIFMNVNTPAERVRAEEIALAAGDTRSAALKWRSAPHGYGSHGDGIHGDGIHGDGIHGDRSHGGGAKGESPEGSASHE